jgi:hypothetical protein
MNTQTDLLVNVWMISHVEGQLPLWGWSVSRTEDAVLRQGTIKGTAGMARTAGDAAIRTLRAHNM